MANEQQQRVLLAAADRVTNEQQAIAVLTAAATVETGAALGRLYLALGTAFLTARCYRPAGYAFYRAADLLDHPAELEAARSGWLMAIHSQGRPWEALQMAEQWGMVTKAGCLADNMITWLMEGTG